MKFPVTVTSEKSWSPYPSLTEGASARGQRVPDRYWLGRSRLSALALHLCTPDSGGQLGAHEQAWSLLATGMFST